MKSPVIWHTYYVSKDCHFALKLFCFGSVGSEISTVKVDVFKNYVAPTKFFKESTIYHAGGLVFYYHWPFQLCKFTVPILVAKRRQV